MFDTYMYTLFDFTLSWHIHTFTEHSSLHEAIPSGLSVQGLSFGQYANHAHVHIHICIGLSYFIALCVLPSIVFYLMCTETRFHGLGEFHF